MKTTKAVLSLVFVLLCSVFPVHTFAAGSQYDAEITAYDVKMDIGENNVFNVTETITVQYHSETMHGINRDIPVWYTTTEGTGEGYVGTPKTTSKKAKITDIKVDAITKISSVGIGRDTKVRIRIGDPDHYVNGAKTYRISYQYAIGADRNKGYDDLYYNLLGTECVYPVSHFTFTIHMPKDVGDAKVDLTFGAKGSTVRLSKSNFAVKDNTISGKYPGTFRPFEPFTIKVRLPDGYFVGAEDAIDYSAVVTLGGAALGVVLAFFLWRIYGKDEKPVETVEFHPPQGLSSAEVGYYVDGIVETKDVLSLILYWANKGYLTIEDKGRHSFAMDRKEHPGFQNRFEQTMFSGIFASGSHVVPKDLKYVFSGTLALVKAQVKDHCEQTVRLYTDTSKRVSFIIYCLAIAVAALAFYGIAAPYTDTWIEAVIAGVGLGLLYSLPVKRLVAKIDLFLSSTKLRVFGTTLNGIVGLLLLNAPLVAIAWYAQASLVSIVAAAVAVVVINSLSVITKKRTPFGIEMLGKLRGFKNFIQTAEKDKLEALVKENPSYFYDVLPYAYVLGVSNTWSKKLEQIAVEPPQWYASDRETYNPSYFYHSIDRGLNRYSDTMRSVQPSSSSSSDGSGGGGGSSGGGGGGGGVSGW